MYLSSQGQKPERTETMMRKVRKASLHLMTIMIQNQGTPKGKEGVQFGSERMVGMGLSCLARVGLEILDKDHKVLGKPRPNITLTRIS